MPLLTLAALASADSCKTDDKPETAGPALNFCSVPASDTADARPAIATQSLSPAPYPTPHFKDLDEAVGSLIETTGELRAQVALSMLRIEAIGARKRGKVAEAYGFESARIEKGNTNMPDIIINGVRYGILRMSGSDKIFLFSVDGEDPNDNCLLIDGLEHTSTEKNCRPGIPADKPDPPRPNPDGRTYTA